jgi:hypothetical protein
MKGLTNGKSKVNLHSQKIAKIPPKTCTYAFSVNRSVHIGKLFKQVFLSDETWSKEVNEFFENNNRQTALAAPCRGGTCPT